MSSIFLEFTIVSILRFYSVSLANNTVKKHGNGKLKYLDE